MVIRIALVLGLAILLGGVVGAGLALLPRPPRDAAELVIPILDANLAYGWPESNSDANRLEDRLDSLIKNQTPSGDEASVLLLDYYLGEHNAELQLCSVAERGNRILPILTRYRQHRPGSPKLRYVISRLNERERDSMFEMAIDAIHSGKQFCD